MSENYDIVTIGSGHNAVRTSARSPATSAPVSSAPVSLPGGKD